MSLEDLEEDEKFILYLSLGILGVILVGAFLLIMMDGWIFAYTESDDDDDDDENEEVQYLGDQMMQTRQSSLQVLQQQQSPAPAPPEQPLRQQQQQQQSSDPTTASVGKTAEPTETTTKATAALAVAPKPDSPEPLPPRDIDHARGGDGDSSDDEDEDGDGPSKEEDEMGDSTRRKHHAVSLKGTVVPRMEKVPLSRFIYLSVLVAIPTIGYIMYFTAMGWGETTFYWMTEHFGEYSSYVGGGTAFFLSVLYLLDANLWTSRCLKTICLEILVLGTVITVLLLTGDYPYGPICCYAAITPLWLISCNQFKCLKGNIRTRDYVSSLSGPLFFCSIITLIGFLGWTFSSAHHQYNEVTKVAYSQATGCVPNLEEYPFCALNYTNPPSLAPTTMATSSSGSSGGGGGVVVTTTNFTVTVAPAAATTTPDDNNNNPALTNAPTFVAEEEANDNNDNNNNNRLLHLVPAWLEHEPHDDDNVDNSNNNESSSPPSEVSDNTTPSSTTATPTTPTTTTTTTTTEEREVGDPVEVEEILKLNKEDTDNVYTAEETGVCFDTVVSPPAFYPRDQSCLIDGCPEKLYNDCLNAFILWAGPLLCSMVLFFLSFFCTFLKGDDAEKDIINFGKLWLFLLFTMWLTAALSGVAGGLSSALVAMTLASFVGSIVFVASTRSKEESKQQGAQVWGRIEENYGAYMDVARGLFLVTCFPFILLYVFFSVLNQAIRKIGLPCSKPLKTPQQKADYLTKRTRNQVTAFLSWDRTKVLTYAVYWGIAFLILQVFVAQFTVVFLSWLIEVTENYNLGLVTAILVGVGMIMFMLPPVPGVPIYLTLGIVVLPVGQDLLGLYGAIAYASAVSLLLKLIACTVQQKLIGELLQGYVSVRKLVGINSTLIKGMRLVLAQPGMGIDKVCILVGGPDWPTSVLCGIMGLPLLPILYGTLPVFLLIFPTVLTGSFTYMANQKDEDTGELLYPYASVLFSVTFAITGLVQFGAMILAAYYLEQTTSNRADEIAAIPIDKEVAELEKAEEDFNNSYDRVTQWPVVPIAMQLILYMAFATIVASCYLVMLWAHLCFAPFELGTSTIDEALDGKFFNILLPLGWVSIGLFLASCVLLWVFIAWASAKAKKEIANAPQQAGETTTNNELVVAQ